MSRRRVSDHAFVAAAFVVYVLAAAASLGAGSIVDGPPLQGWLFWWPIVAALPFFGLVLGRTGWLEQHPVRRVVLLSAGTVAIALLAMIVTYIILAPGVLMLTARWE
jgi:hypothetical protein